MLYKIYYNKKFKKQEVNDIKLKNFILPEFAERKKIRFLINQTLAISRKIFSIY